MERGTYGISPLNSVRGAVTSYARGRRPTAGRQQVFRLQPAVQGRLGRQVFTSGCQAWDDLMRTRIAKLRTCRHRHHLVTFTR
jgi:hypothetical protein